MAKRAPLKLDRQSPLTIVVTAEGLATSGLGCYGCSWNETPAIDSLAADGVVFDRWTSHDERPGGLLMEWINGSTEFLDAQHSLFVTDDPIIEIPALGFGDARFLPIAANSAPATSDEESSLAKTFMGGVDRIRPSTQLLWLHTGILRDVWDAPFVPEPDDSSDTEPTEDPLLVSEDGQAIAEPEPFRLSPSIAVPSIKLSGGDDPDLLFAWINRYAAQVRLFDRMLGLLIDSLAGRKITVLVAGTSGMSLGENGWFGFRVGPLRSSQIRLPLISSVGGPLRIPHVKSSERFPEMLRQLIRDEPIVTPESWCRTDQEFDPRIFTRSDRAEQAVTTSTWFGVGETDADGLRTSRLFLKPDDVNDANDIARLRREIVERLFDSDDSLNQPADS